MENWIWVNTPKVAEVLSWSGDKALYSWLQENGWLDANAEKPHPPKEAMEAVLKQNRRKPVAYMFKEIADSVSYRRCTDPAFQKMLAMLKVWFCPPNTDEP
ncbi:MAG: hypothetical protein IT270_08070 [Saprospiraceae bacterium]|nr:hypothetical protein [Saprospiraceae bacterium]